MKTPPPSSHGLIPEGGGGESGKCCIFGPFPIHPDSIQGGPAPLSLIASYVNTCWSTNVYVHDGDVNVHVHSL